MKAELQLRKLSPGEIILPGDFYEDQFGGLHVKTKVSFWQRRYTEKKRPHYRFMSGALESSKFTSWFVTNDYKPVMLSLGSYGVVDEVDKLYETNEFGMLYVCSADKVIVYSKSCRGLQNVQECQDGFRNFLKTIR